MSLQLTQLISSTQNLSTPCPSNSALFDPCSFVSELSLTRRNLSESIKHQNSCNFTDLIRNLQLENQITKNKTTQYTAFDLQEIISEKINKTEFYHDMFNKTLKWFNAGTKEFTKHCDHYKKIYQEQMEAAKEDSSIAHPPKIDLCSAQDRQANLSLIANQLQENSNYVPEFKTDICRRVKKLLEEDYPSFANETYPFNAPYFLSINETSRNLTSNRFRIIAMGLQDITCNIYSTEQRLHEFHAELEKNISDIEQLKQQLQFCQSPVNISNIASFTITPRKEESIEQELGTFDAELEKNISDIEQLKEQVQLSHSPVNISNTASFTIPEEKKESTSWSWSTIVGVSGGIVAAIIATVASIFFCKRKNPLKRGEYRFEQIQLANP